MAESAVDTLAKLLAAMLPAANKLFGTAAATWDELVDIMLPPRLSLLKRLSVLYEKEMLACRDAKAYFPACIMGAAMLEAFLLLLCTLNRDQVANTKCYRSQTGKRAKDFDQAICYFGFEDLVEIAAELNWVPATLVSDNWKTALAETYQEIAKERRPNMSKADRNRRAASLTTHPAYSLMLLLNAMRNRVHPGRWVRERHLLENEEAFAGWAQVAIVGAAHIRDCLLQHSQKDLAALMNRLMHERAAKHRSITPIVS